MKPYPIESLLESVYDLELWEIRTIGGIGHGTETDYTFYVMAESATEAAALAEEHLAKERSESIVCSSFIASVRLFDNQGVLIIVDGDKVKKTAAKREALP